MLRTLRASGRANERSWELHMTNERGRTIRLFLVSGNPAGLILARSVGGPERLLSFPGRHCQRS